MTTTNIKGDSAYSWTDADYSIALVHLNQLQNQLTDLRALLPNLIQPLTLVHGSPESLLVNFKHSAFRAAHLLKSFRAQWDATETSQILQQIQTKRDAEIKGLNTNRLVLNHRSEEIQDVVIGDDLLSTGNLREDHTRETESQNHLSILNTFREMNPDISVKETESDAFIEVYVPTKSGQFRFAVTEITKPAKFYQIICRGNSKLCQALTNALKERSGQNDLQYTLDNLAAYRNLFTEKCASCTRLLDPDAMLPVLKVLSRNSSSSEEYKSSWLSYHGPCIK